LELQNEVGNVVFVEVTDDVLIVASHAHNKNGTLTVYEIQAENETANTSSRDAGWSTASRANQTVFVSETVGDQFGVSLSGTSRFDLLCAGAPSTAAGAGAVYIFNMSSWELIYTLGGSSGAKFGSSIGIVARDAASPTGTTLRRDAILAVSSPGTSTVDTFVIYEDQYVFIGSLISPPSELIEACAISEESIMFISSSNSPTDTAPRRYIHHTTFCPRNFARSHRFYDAPTFDCRPCPASSASTGGLSEFCTACNGADCFEIGSEVNGLPTYVVPIVQTDSGGLKTGTSIQIEVGVVSQTGTTASNMSTFVIFDDTPPAGLLVIDGVGNPSCLMCDENRDSDAQVETDILTLSWNPFTDAESGIAEQKVCIGTIPGGCDTLEVPIENISITSLTVNAPELPALAVNQTYYATVVATNGAGAETAISSDGLTVDHSAPVMVAIYDGFTARDVDNQEMTNLIIANWHAEDDQSKVFYETRLIACTDGLEWNGTKRPDKCKDCQNKSVLVDWAWAKDLHRYGFVDLPNPVCGPFANLSCSRVDLLPGHCYYVEARALNEAGYTSTSLQTNGIKVGTAEVAVDPDEPMGMMFDTGPANVGEKGANKTDNGNGASPDKPLVGAFTMPAGAVDSPVTMQAGRVGKDAYENGDAVDPEESTPSGFQFGGYSFEIGVADEDGNRVDGFVFNKPAIIALAYEPETLLGDTGQDPEASLIPELMLYDVYSDGWINAMYTCPPPGKDEPLPWQNIDEVNMIYEVAICHLTQFAVAINFDDCFGNTCVEEVKVGLSADASGMMRSLNKCVDGVDEYTCDCLPGFEGEKCERSINECDWNMCSINHTTPPFRCVDNHNNYTCLCDGGWGGHNCDDFLYNVTDPAAKPFVASIIPMLITSICVVVTIIAIAVIFVHYRLDERLRSWWKRRIKTKQLLDIETAKAPAIVPRPITPAWPTDPTMSIRQIAQNMQRQARAISEQRVLDKWSERIQSRRQQIRSLIDNLPGLKTEETRGVSIDGAEPEPENDFHQEGRQQPAIPTRALPTPDFQHPSYVDAFAIGEAELGGEVEVVLNGRGPIGIAFASDSTNGPPRVESIATDGQMKSHTAVAVGMTLLSVDGQVVTSYAQGMPLLISAGRPVRLQFSAAPSNSVL
jgi:hypothetical protein